jgi:hypothetical protein
MTGRWLESGCSRPSPPDPDLVVFCGEEAENRLRANLDNRAIGDAGWTAIAVPPPLLRRSTPRIVFARGNFCVLFCVVPPVRR